MNANEVEIEFCVPCGLLPQAEKAGYALLSTYGESIHGLKFRPSHGGVFRISMDGENIFDKASGEGFDMDTVVARVGDRLRSPPYSWDVMGEPPTTVGLAWQGMVARPDVAGGDNAVGESGLLAVLGSALGWWIARRQGRGEPD